MKTYGSVCQSSDVLTPASPKECPLITRKRIYRQGPYLEQYEKKKHGRDSPFRHCFLGAPGGVCRVAAFDVSDWSPFHLAADLAVHQGGTGVETKSWAPRRADFAGEG